jgi:SAM-dependent methyltransferase
MLFNKKDSGLMAGAPKQPQIQNANAMPQINYDHSGNVHTVTGAKATLERLFTEKPPKSLLDVGCGTGTWLRAALDLGVDEIYGIDGVPIQPSELLIPDQFFRVEDLSETIDLGRKFDIALCLEVAEHLPAAVASELVATLVVHSDLIMFSAASPGQFGQHHVNCQWPSYWQSLFNAQGYTCEDNFRWEIWDITDIEPWYRQNIFLARRASQIAGREPRLRSVIHPGMLYLKAFDAFRETELCCINGIENGSESVYWYTSLLPRALIAKARRRLLYWRAGTKRS